MENSADIYNVTQDVNATDYVDFPEMSQYDLTLRTIIGHLNLYAIPVIIAVGLIGNTASFLVYICTPRLRRQSSSVYLGFLAAVDSCFLLCLFVVWFGWVGIHALHMNGWCHIIPYATYVCGLLSTWTVIAFTFERWVVVFMPLKRYQLCTRRRAILTMSTISIFALAFYTFSLWSTKVTTYPGDVQVCAPTSRYYKLLKVMTSLDTILGVIIPCLAIVVMNTGIGIKLCRYTNRGPTSVQPPLESVDDALSNFSYSRDPFDQEIALQTTCTDRTCSETNPVTRSRSGRFLTKRRHTQLKITRALLIVSTVFVFLNLPSYAFRLHAFVLSLRNERLRISPTEYFWSELLVFLHYINFASNFFLYSACSRNFRYALKRLLHRAHRKLKKCIRTPNRSMPQNNNITATTPMTFDV